jgi:hypothetical protein
MASSLSSLWLSVFSMFCRIFSSSFTISGYNSNSFNSLIVLFRVKSPQNVQYNIHTSDHYTSTLQQWLENYTAQIGNKHDHRENTRKIALHKENTRKIVLYIRRTKT